MKKGKKLSNKVFGAIVFPVLAILLVVTLVANYFLNQYASIISIFLNQSTYEIVDETPTGLAGTLDLEYIKSDYSIYDSNGKLTGYDLNARDAHDTALGIEVEAEGIVLLYNKDNALPLTGKSVTLFSKSSVNLLYSGGGSGVVDTSTVKDLKTALEDGGFSVNPTVWDFYKSVLSDYARDQKGVHEVPPSVFDTSIEASIITGYHDAAIVVLAREGQENIDITTNERDEGGYMMQLSNEEKQLLEYVNGKFDTVIVLINSCNTMELGFLEEYENIKACLLVGYFGSTGIDALPKILTGEINPSGRLSDTYAYDSFSSPAMQNFLQGRLSNESVSSFPVKKSSFVVYAEGIYVGYKYYETRYEDAILGQGNAGNYDYATAVQFPFGYGMSYTTFEWSNFTVSETDATYEIDVTVKNTGHAAGKDVVEIYMQSPYTEYDRANKVEKASVELVGFAKTGTISAGGSETVHISVPKEVRRAYDAYGAGTYILDAGTYYFTAAQDAHQALNNIIAVAHPEKANSLVVIENTTTTSGSMVYSSVVAEQDNTIYSSTVNYDGSTGAAIANQFDNADVKTYESDFNYLSRSDWTGTFPTQFKDRRWSIPDDLAQAIVGNPYQDDPNAVMPETNAGNGMVLLDMMGKDYDDPDWELLLDNLNADIMNEMIALGGWQTIAIPEINKPASKDIDGPAGISSTLGGEGDSGARCVNMPAGTIEACTWNYDLMVEVGKAIGEDGMTSGYQGWYAPGAGIHRTPYGGRNFEYFSEDGFLTGKMSAAETLGIQSKGMYCYMKHFVLNDQEVDRFGITEFINEQALREIYAYAFEIAVREADCRGMMAGFDCIGPYWCGANTALLTNVLRDEWGFKGIVVTDYASANSAYMLIDAGTQAGSDLWLNTAGGIYDMPNAASNATQMQALRRATKNILYTVLQTSAMNGVSAYTKVKIVTPPWKIAMYAVDAAVAVVVIGGCALAIRRIMKNKKTEV